MFINAPTLWKTVILRGCIMNKKISETHQKRPVLTNGGKKEYEAIESWMIEEYYVPYQAS